MVISRVTQESYIWKPGRRSITWSSQEILPASTRVASAATVNALPVDPVSKMVSTSTASGAPQLAHAEAVQERGLVVLRDGNRHAPAR